MSTKVTVIVKVEKTFPGIFTTKKVFFKNILVQMSIITFILISHRNQQR